MRVVIADDNVLLRAGLVRLLSDAGHDVVAAVGDAPSLIDAVERQQPDIAVIDVRMPPTNTDDGLRAALEIRDRWPDISLVVLSQYVEEEYAADLLGRGGAHVGYLLKDRVADVAEFIDSVERIAAGAALFDPEVIAQILARSRRRDPLATLTPREREVLSLMAEGCSNSAISSRLVVSAGAVEKHVGNIFSKFNLEPAEGDHRRVLAVLRWLRL